MNSAWWNFIPEYVLEPRFETEIPLDWKKMASNAQQLHVEIGFGNGDFIVNMAKQYPQSLFVGFEISLESVERAVKRCITHEVKNIRFIRGDAGTLLRELFPPNSIQHVYMNFPDPWPKKRHENKRLIKPPFLQTLANVLELNGIYELTTDQEDYANAAKSLFEQSDYFAIKTFEKNPQRPIQTKYEKKWIELGRNIYQLQVQKIKHCEVQRIFEGEPMPHVKIRKEINPVPILKKIVGQEYRTDRAFFKVLEMFVNEDKHLLLKVVSTDSDFMQNYFIKIVKRTDEWLVKLDEITQPFRTPSVKFSVFEIGRILSKEK